MVDKSELESLYRDAQSALKGRDYVRASELLRQILQIDENYKDVSRLLAQMVKLRRRRWYNDPRIWGTTGALIVIALVFVLAPKVSGLFAKPAPVTPTVTIRPTNTVPPTDTLFPTETIAPTPTSIPLAWKRINIGQEFTRDKIITVEIGSKDQDLLYVNTENASFYQSIDGGISWRPIQIENVPVDISMKLIANNNLNQDEVTNTGPDGKTRSYSAAMSANWRVSEDNGKTWSEFGIIGKPPSHAITFDTEGSVYVYCDSHLCKYSPDGNQRVTLGKPDIGAFTIIAISLYDPNTIYVAGSGMSVSKDGGLTWTKLNNGLGSEPLQLDTGVKDSSLLYLQSGKCDGRDFGLDKAGQPLYLSSDSGRTWTLSIETGCYLTKDANGSTIYRVGQGVVYSENAVNWIGWIWRSQDGGKSWQKLIAPSFVQTVIAHTIESGVLYGHIGSEEGNDLSERDIISEDYGHTWKDQDPHVTAKACYGSSLRFIDKYRPMAIDPVDGNHVFVIDNGMLLESHDSCETTHAFATVPNTNLNSIAFDPNNSDILYAGTDEGAYISFDSGATWNQINDGLLGATVVYSIVVDKDSNVYAATPYGIFKLEGK